MNKHPLIIQHLGFTDYESTWKAMRTFTENRTENTPDQLWLLEHLPVFTQGQAGKKEHLLTQKTPAIPVVYTDRGGQITYHGPGQLIAYVLIDIKRRDFTVRQFVCSLEKIIITLLAQFDISAHRTENAPGVYFNNAKLCSLGLRIKKGASYHGLSLNIDMDLTPFSQINPCGRPNLAITQMKDINSTVKISQVISCFIHQFTHILNYEIKLNESFLSC